MIYEITSKNSQKFSKTHQNHQKSSKKLENLDQTFLLTLAALALPAFWGTNAGFPWDECMNGDWSRRSPELDPDGRSRSVFEYSNAFSVYYKDN